MVEYSNHGKRWTDEEMKDLVTNYRSGISVEKCASRYKRKPSAIASKLFSHGILKDEKWLKELEKYNK